jgi:hypothetical protein
MIGLIMMDITNLRNGLSESLLPTMYKNNSGLIARIKVSKYKKGLCLTEKLVCINPLLFLYQTLPTIIKKRQRQRT